MKHSLLTTALPLGLLGVCASLTVAQTGDKEGDLVAARKARIAQVVPKEPIVEPEETRTLLVFALANGFVHPSIPTGKMALALMGDATGAYEAVISDDLENFLPENISKFDAICFLNTSGDPFSPPKGVLAKMNAEEKAEVKEHSDILRKSLMNYIAGGGGFVGIHAATDTFSQWPEYGKMINGYFNGHPWNGGTKVSVKVEPGKENHPLTKMFGGENLNVTEEIYQLKDPYNSADVNMLLRLDTEQTSMDVKGIKREDQDFGISWHRSWDQGRVFYSSLGHNHHIYWNNKVLRHYLAGIQYAMGDLQVDDVVAE